MNIAILSTLLITIFLYFLIGAKGHWSIKFLLIGISVWVGIIILNAINSYKGYPTSQEVPEKYLLHWVVISPPNKQKGTEGAIYLWVSALIETDKGILDYKGTEPRTYRLPYSNEIHIQMENILNRLMGGETVIGTKNKKGNGNGDGNGRGNGEGDKENGGFGGFSIGGQSYNFGPLPPAVYPEKKKQGEQ